MFGSTIGPGEILVVLLLALVIFGPKKLPELGQGLGRGMRDFKRAVSGDDDDDAHDPRPAVLADDVRSPVATLVQTEAVADDPVAVQARPAETR